MGSAPGTLTAHEDLPAAVVQRVVFDLHSHESADMPLGELTDAVRPQPGKVVWLDVQGLGDSTTIQRMGDALGLHPLTVEDIVHVNQRPKLEQFDDYLFVVLRAVRLLDDGAVENEQVSLVLKKGLLVTFQERPGDGFSPVRRRLREGKGAARKSGADYLAYALLDAAIDNYFPVVERYQDSMDQLDDEIRDSPSWEKSAAIHVMRRELRQLRRAVWPLRDVAASLGRGDLAQISSKVRPALRDCHDHVIQVADFVESARERASDLGDLYMTIVSERTNQVMKVLTIIATIFIPLTFLCGLYGMNFDTSVSPYNLPELKWRYGYLALWALMLVTVIGMLVMFRVKGWIGGGGGGRGRDTR